jgi:hypothetical protein
MVSRVYKTDDSIAIFFYPGVSILQRKHVKIVVIFTLV